jgi:PAS domain S-box-containing protein
LGRHKSTTPWKREEGAMSAPIRILLLEDDPNDAQLVEDLLEADQFVSRVVCVQSRAEFLAALKNGDLDLILSDYSLPVFDGLSALSAALSARPDVPFIFVSGTIGEEAAIEALKVGATDYVLKTRMSRLVPAVRRALGEARDRAARQAAEDALRRSEKELRDVIEAIPAIAFTAQPDGRSVWTNRQWVEFSGLSVEETSGLGWQSAVHPEDVTELSAKWHHSMATGEPFEHEARHSSAKGEYRWFLVRAVPLRDEQGGILKWYGILTDIEDRKRAEQERRRLHQLEAELAQMNRVSMMGELAASLAHEIKQPITAGVISANACSSWLRSDRLDIGEAQAAAEGTISSLRRAADIIDRVRALYGPGKRERELVDVNEVIREMTIMLGDTATRNSVTLSTQFAASISETMADRVQLQQVLMNLMLNGIEAMQKTGGELSVASKMTEDGQLLISVNDTGSGLPPDQAERIFKPFVTTKTQGTGMGLSISRRIIESHGGRLWAAAKADRGTIFQFTLPSKVTVG